LHRQENELSSVKAKLQETQDRNLELEKEKEDRYTKIKAEVFENSVQLLQGHQRAHDQSMQRITHLERELEQVNAGSANVEDLRRRLEERQIECTELQQALEELELQQIAEREALEELELQQTAERAQAMQRITHLERELQEVLDELEMLDELGMQQSAERAQSAERIAHLERELEQARRQISTLETHNLSHHLMLEERQIDLHDIRQELEMQQSAERAQSAERIRHLERDLDQARRQIDSEHINVKVKAQVLRYDCQSAHESKACPSRRCIRPCMSTRAHFAQLTLLFCSLFFHCCLPFPVYCLPVHLLSCRPCQL
jgi:chromosome segregation ATPase